MQPVAVWAAGYDILETSDDAEVMHIRMCIYIHIIIVLIIIIIIKTIITIKILLSIIIIITKK